MGKVQNKVGKVYFLESTKIRNLFFTGDEVSRATKGIRNATVV
jgi:hypothetical protein